MIYLIAPNANHPSGGVGVAANWVRMLRAHGHEAMFITPNGDPSPYWLNFTVPAGSYANVVDSEENFVVHIWMDCLIQFRTHKAKLFYFAQDASQPQNNETYTGRFEAEYLPILKTAKLITLTHHQHWFYLYRWGLRSQVVYNAVDTDLFKPAEKAPNSVCMIAHRDHYNPELHERLNQIGMDVRVAQGNQQEIATVMGACRFFVTDVAGRFDGYEYSEGMPMPILEAMAAGCIVFCRDTNGVREVITEGLSGIILPNDDVYSGLVSGMLKEIEFNDRYGIIARAAVMNRFSESFVWNQIEEALEL